MQRSGSGQTRRFKVVIIGDADVGKTSLLGQYVDGRTVGNSQSSIGVDFKTKTIEVDGEQIRLQMWDTAGQERFHKPLSRIYYRGAQGVLITYDITRQETFDGITRWLQETDKYLKSNDVIKVLAGNKADLEDKRVVDYNVAKQLADQLGAEYVETSAITAQNVEQLFLNMAVAMKDRHKNSGAQGRKAFTARDSSGSNTGQNSTDAQNGRNTVNAVDSGVNSISEYTSKGSDVARGSECVGNGISAAIDVGRTEDGSADIATNVGRSEDGSADIATDVGRAEDGFADIATNVGCAEDGSADIATNVERTEDGSAVIATNVGRTEDGCADIATNVGRTEDGCADITTNPRRTEDGSAVIATNVGRTEDGSADIAINDGRTEDGSADIATNVGRTEDGSADIATNVRRAEDGSADATDVGRREDGSADTATNVERTEDDTVNISTNTRPTEDRATSLATDDGAADIATKEDKVVDSAMDASVWDFVDNQETDSMMDRENEPPVVHLSQEKTNAYGMWCHGCC